jgi:hypothetical protein
VRLGSSRSVSSQWAAWRGQGFKLSSFKLHGFVSTFQLGRPWTVTGCESGQKPMGAFDGVATRWRCVKEELERQKLRTEANGMANGGSRGGWRTAWWQVDNGLANGVANGEWRGEWEMKTSTTEAEEESRRGRWWGEGVTVQQRYLGCLLRNFMPCSPLEYMAAK